MKKFLLSIFAVLFAFTGVQAQTWTKVTDASTLKAGDKLVIACDSKGFVASATISSSVMKNETATFSSDKTTMTSLPAGAAILTLGGTSGAWTLSNENSKLLGATAAKKVAWGSGTTTWSISIDVDGNATIQNGTSSYGRFLYNVNSPRFTTYTSNASSSMLLPQLYRLEVAGGEGGGETPETPVAPAAPTLPAACNFDDAMTVEITGIAEGATAYYSLNDENNWIEGSSVEITETTTVYAKAVKDELSSDVVSATYTKNTPVTPPAEGEVVDVINIETIGIDSYGSYTSWTGVQSNSSAVYAGQSHKNGEAVQLRATSPSGIISTASAGKLKKIVVKWASGTSGGRTLNVYGKNTAYSTAADLYSTSTQGTLLGTIVCGTSTELVIEGDYEYIGMRSNSGAMYLTSISITWDESAGVTPVAPNAPVLPASTTFKGSMLVEITGIAADATVYYTTDESDPATSDTRVEYTEPFEITATTTVKAIAVNEVGTSEMATATYTYLEPIDLSDCTVTEAIEAFKNGHTGEATITGYIVGTMVNNEVVFGDISTAANLLIADDADEEDPAKCIPVQLSSGTKIREVLSLKDTPANMGRKITVVGSLEAYFSRAGLKSLSSAGLYWNVSSAGYATLYLDYKAEIPSTVKAYIVTGVETGYVTLTQVEGILPIETGVILEGEGEHLFNITSDEAADVKNNLLEGTVDATEIDVEAYVLGNVDGVGLYKAKMTDGVWLNNANKAYLPAVAGAANVASYSFRFGEGTTGIDQITDNRVQSTVIYDLTGRRVENISAPGIYIINGVKTLVK